jgi:peptide methionine sulfoxide reductase MsrB
MKILIGNTYNLRNEIKASGGKWDQDSKTWSVPDDKHEELQKKVNRQKKSDSGAFQFYVKKDCRGRYECDNCGDDVYPGTECWETGLKH